MTMTIIMIMTMTMTIMTMMTDDDDENVFLKVDAKIYDEIPDANLLTKAMEHYLNEHNSVSKAPLPLVMFRFAVEHTSRIIR